MNRTPKSETDSISGLTHACQFLPEENRHLAHSLFSHLHQVMNDAEENKMGVLNLQLIFSPCLNIEPVIVQYLIKYPEILRKQNPTPNPSYTLVESSPKSLQWNRSPKRATESAEAPQKPARSITKSLI